MRLSMKLVGASVVLTSLFSLTVLTSCSGDEKIQSDSSSGTGLPDIGQPGTPSATAGFTIVVSPSASLVPSTIYKLHKLIGPTPSTWSVGGSTGMNWTATWDQSWDTDCKISNDTLASGTYDERHMYCIAEAAEENIYFGGAKLQVNVPAGLCDYATVAPYTYFNLPVGEGQTSYTWTEDTSGGCVTPDATSGTCSVTCPYDYTLNGGPNCCEGTYSKTVTVNSATPTTTTTAGAYGGKHSACLAGAGMMSAEFTKLSSGAPATMISYAGAGYNGIFDFKTPISKQTASVVPIANFWKPSQQAGQGVVGYSDYLRTDAGAAKGTPYFPPAFEISKSIRPNPFYEITCYDTAREVKGRIRLMIRSWDEAANISPTGDADSGGAETSPTGCLQEPNGQCIKDFENWNSISNKAGATGFPADE